MTDEIYETPSTTPNFRTELAAQLADLIPEAIADGKVDVEKLKELLDGDVADSSERFGLFWPGKKRALRAAQEPTTATLKPDFDNSKDWDTTKNVFIEGDNLEVLKILQKHYHAKIKMIYIDPPYNTGKDFVYPDNYKEGLDTYLEWTRQVNEEGKKVTTNAETEGRYHSNWLNMMYPRLKLARNLLTDDGVIFISIDDNEVDNLQKLCREIFGESNVETIVWHKVGDDSGRLKITHRVRREHEYIIACYRDVRSVFFKKYMSDRNYKNTYTNPDDDPRGPYKQGIISHTEEKSREGGKNFYEVVTPSGKVFRRQWRMSRDEFDKLHADGRIYYGRSGDSVPSLKVFINEQGETTPTTLMAGLGTAKSAGQALSGLFSGMRYFDYPKPVELIKRLVLIASDDESTVLDFFAGSGTTGEAVMAANAEGGSARRFLLVQLPEPTDSGSIANQDGFDTISAITRRRLELAGNAIGSRLGGDSVDVGYRAFKLTDTNFAKWRLSSDVAEDALHQHLLSLRDSATDDATADDLLTEILLKQGYSLTEDISPAEIGGLDVRLVRDRDGDVAVLAYLNEHVKPTLEQLRALVDESPAKIIVLEDAFQGDDELKTNLAQLCKSKGIELWTA